jgi:dTDP-4-dehydrorhamnose reductase
MKILVTGAGGYIGNALVAELSRANEVTATTKRDLDLLELGDLWRFPYPEVTYLCAAKTRFIDCEADPQAYRINVDAQIELAKFFSGSKVIFLSSEAVERALHTNYGMHKALVEMGLRTVCNPVIARICTKVSDETLPNLIQWLGRLRSCQPGVYRWA